MAVRQRKIGRGGHLVPDCPSDGRMKLKVFIGLTIFLAVLAVNARSQQAPKPLTKDQVMGLVQAGMETPELVKLIHEHGIDFDPTDDYLQALGKEGAQEPVLQALRAARPKPLTREQVLQLLTGHVPLLRAAALVNQNGIDFFPDEPYFEMLRLAGGDDTLIAAVRAAGEAVGARLEVETSPHAEVFLDGQPVGRAGPDGRLVDTSKPGVHALRVSLEGKKDFEQKITLVVGQANKLSAALEDLPQVVPAPSTPAAKGYLGVSVGDLNESLAKQFKLPDAVGALAEDVAAGGPADKAGIKSGDVIRKLNGNPVANALQLTSLVTSLNPGAVAMLDILRDGQPLTLRATLGARPASLDVRSETGGVENGALRGITVVNLTPALREQWRVSVNATGVVIVKLDPKSPAVQFGLQAGDVIESISRQPVRNIADFNRLGAQAKGQTLLRISRQGDGMFVVITPEESGSGAK